MSYLKSKRDRRACAAKQEFHSPGDAWAAAKGTGITARVYSCPGLKGKPKHWHITGGGVRL